MVLWLEVGGDILSLSVAVCSHYTHSKHMTSSKERTLLYATPQCSHIPHHNALICHTTMRRNAINFLYNASHVTLECLNVVPVFYARVVTTFSSTIDVIHIKMYTIITT